MCSPEGHQRLAEFQGNRTSGMQALLGENCYGGTFFLPAYLRPIVPDRDFLMYMNNKNIVQEDELLKLISLDSGKPNAQVGGGARLACWD